jgi:uroporphyrinogen decarboxylase
MPTPMTSRQRVLAAIHRRTPDRVPREILLEHRVADRLAVHFGTRDLVTALRQDIVYTYPTPTRFKTDFSPYFNRPGVTWDEWGRGRIWDSEMHYAEYLYPLEHAETVDEILHYPFPDVGAPYRVENLQKKVAAQHARGFAVYGDVSETFEIAWQIRSMDRLFEDMLHDDEKATVVLDQITDCNAALARAYALAGVDILYTGDDVAMQTGLMMSKKLWRQWLGPRLKKVIQAARDILPDLPVQYHSDGKINDLIPDLIDAGVTILNPVQPECVDHAWVKAAYGAQLAFHSGLGVQSVLPFGSPEDVRQHVRAVIATLGAGGGLVVGPSHVIERDTSLENILAMLAAIDEFGQYN